MEEQKNFQKEKQELMDNPKLDVDRILTEELGQFGWYQARFMMVTAPLVVIFASLGVQYIFTTARIQTRCLIPECENATQHVKFAAQWLSHALPNTATGFDNCRRFTRAPFNSSSPIESNTTDYCPVTLFDRTTTEPCEAYVYENTDTIVYDFDLACDEWRRSLVGSMGTLGTLFADPLTGYISDRWGRRTALIFNLLNSGLIGIFKYWANSYTVFIAIDFVTAILGSRFYSTIYITIMEMVGPKYRVAVKATTATIYALGHALTGTVAAFVPNWRHMILVLYIAHLTCTSVTIWFTSESVRWYITKGHSGKAEKLLKEMARVNGKQLSETSLLALQQAAKIDKDPEMIKHERKTKEPWLILLVLEHKSILLRCFVASVWWTSFSFIFYGLTVNSMMLSVGNKLVNYLAVSLFEVPGYLLACLLVNRVGRKPVLAGAFWVTALALVGFILTPADYSKISLALYMVGKGTISTAVVTLYVYTSELFPTDHRHSLFAFCHMIGRVGSIVAPLTPVFGGSLPFIMFTGLALLSGLLALLTPETLGTRLPDTMEEAVRLGRDEP